MAVSPDGAHVYVAGSDTWVFGRDAGTGRLTPVEAEAQDGRWVTLSPDGAHVYVATSAGYQGPNTITVLGRNAGTGELTIWACGVHRLTR